MQVLKCNALRVLINGLIGYSTSLKLDSIAVSSKKTKLYSIVISFGFFT